MKILIISPYHGGSHQAWAEGYQKHSRHEVSLLTLPDRFWKWRMHGSAVTLARRFLADGSSPDLILATDMLDISTFLALTRPQTAHIPVVYYMHENQLTYPLPSDGRTGPMRRQLGERDYHYAFINYASMLAADAVLFNSQFHFDSWFTAVPNFLKHFPEYNELNSVAKIQRKSSVLPVGVDYVRLEVKDWRLDNLEQPPLILWNQRWEYDKNPEAFFKALYQIAREGYEFRLALCGQQFGKRPLVFDEAVENLNRQIIHVGQAAFKTYRRLLWEADLTISTANHEFFGISILEAVHCRTFPILPHRLSYPELIPESFHLSCLYQNEGGLLQRLKWALDNIEEARRLAQSCATAVAHFDWTQLAPQYDLQLSALV